VSISSLVLIIILLVAGGGALIYYGSRESRSRNRRSIALRQYREYLEEQGEIDPDLAEVAEVTPTDDKIEETKKKAKKKKSEPTVEELLFMAGKLSTAEKLDFYRKRKLAPIVFGLIGLVLGGLYGTLNGLMMGVFIGVLLGLYLPMKILRGWVREQHEDLAYYLPLLIEQITIGVSSSLDIGPCLSQIVQMADERKSHNAATQMIKYALFYVKSGVGLEEALIEIGKASGHPEFKHALLALSQVSKFGGEVSKQLQDLGDAVTSAQEIKIETEVKKLELKATGPVMVTFLAYMTMIGLGVAAQILINVQSQFDK
jgi:Flp pilus assembly protein TadB